MRMQKNPEYANNQGNLNCYGKRSKSKRFLEAQTKESQTKQGGKNNGQAK